MSEAVKASGRTRLPARVRNGVGGAAPIGPNICGFSISGPRSVRNSGTSVWASSSDAAWSSTSTGPVKASPTGACFNATSPAVSSRACVASWVGVGRPATVRACTVTTSRSGMPSPACVSAESRTTAVWIGATVVKPSLLTL